MAAHIRRTPEPVFPEAEEVRRPERRPLHPDIAHAGPPTITDPRTMGERDTDAPRLPVPPPAGPAAMAGPRATSERDADAPRLPIPPPGRVSPRAAVHIPRRSETEGYGDEYEEPRPPAGRVTPRATVHVPPRSPTDYEDEDQERLAEDVDRPAAVVRAPSSIRPTPVTRPVLPEQEETRGTADEARPLRPDTGLPTPAAIAGPRTASERDADAPRLPAPPPGRVTPRAAVHIPRRSETEDYGDEPEEPRDADDAQLPVPPPAGPAAIAGPRATSERDADAPRLPAPPPGRVSPRAAVHVPPRSLTEGYGDEEEEPRAEDADQGGPDAPIDDRLMELQRNAQEAEDRRESHFRHNEDERDRIFLDNEGRRDQVATQRRDDIYQELKDRIDESLAGIRPDTRTIAEDGAHRPTSIHESVYTAAQDAASRHAADIMDTVRLEREELARERDAAAADRERLEAERDAARIRAEEECQAKISALEEELARVREELENERQQRITEEAEAREMERREALERHEAVSEQLGDITNLVQEQRDECARKKELMEERWAEKQTRREQKDSKLQDLHDMVAKIVEDREAEKIRAEEERLANEGKPGRSYDVLLLG